MDEWAVLDHLSALVDKSLVVADAGEAPRYRLLESARAFALEQLAAGETADMLRRHAVVMRDFLRRVDDANLDGELRTDQFAGLVLPELDNLRAAHAWATGEAGDPQVARGARRACRCAHRLRDRVRGLAGAAQGSTSSRTAWTPRPPRATGGRLPPATWSAACRVALQLEAASRAAGPVPGACASRAGSFPA